MPAHAKIELIPAAPDPGDGSGLQVERERSARSAEKTLRPPAMIISIDFELQWGVLDRRPLDREQRNRLAVAREAVLETLDLFRVSSVHATWATVGLLFAGCREEAEHFLPPCRPHYQDKSLDPYAEAFASSARNGPYYFAPDLIARIAATPGQEIASHSFSHYYCLERGQGLREFAADLGSAVAIASHHGYRLGSYVFPRNQVNPLYLPALAQHGIAAYRAPQDSRPWRAQPFAEQRSSWKRALRLLDAYWNVLGNQTAAWPSSMAPLRFVSSRYLRPCGPAMEGLARYHERRIRQQMKAAVERQQIFHLWFHPEDFAGAKRENLEQLRRIIWTFEEFRDRHGMVSLSMAEAARMEAGDGKRCAH